MILNILNTVSTIFYIISLISVLFSILIIAIAPLRQSETANLHMQLFISLLLSDIFGIMWHKTVGYNTAVLLENEVWCQVLHVIKNTFMLSNCMLLLVEGVNLHFSLVVVFVPDDYLKKIVATAWGSTMLIIITYINLKIYVFKETKWCWLQNSEALWIIVIPVMISIIASVALVAKIVLSLLRNPVNRNNTVAAKKAILAAIILIPLFTLHLAIIPFRPSPGAKGEMFFEIFTAVVPTLQGFVVSVLFCFSNNGVQEAVKYQYARMMRRRANALAMRVIAEGESVEHTRVRVCEQPV